MLSILDARIDFKKYWAGTGSNLKAAVEYNDLYLIMAYYDRPGVEVMDPFYCVDKETGEVKEFSIITDGNMTDILDLFEKGGV